MPIVLPGARRPGKRSRPSRAPRGPSRWRPRSRPPTHSGLCDSRWSRPCWMPASSREVDVATRKQKSGTSEDYDFPMSWSAKDITDWLNGMLSDKSTVASVEPWLDPAADRLVATVRLRQHAQTHG